MRKKYVALSASMLMLLAALPGATKPVSVTSADLTWAGSTSGAIGVVYSDAGVTALNAEQSCGGSLTETWSATSIDSSTVEPGKAGNPTRVNAFVTATHQACDGTVTTESVRFALSLTHTSRTDRTRNAETGERILTTFVEGTVTLPANVVPGAIGATVETISRG